MSAVASSIVEHGGEEETHLSKTSSPSKLSHSMARFLGLESTESTSNKPHKQIPDSPNRSATTSSTFQPSSSPSSRHSRSTPPSSSSHAPPSASLPPLPSSPTTPTSMRRGSRREPDDERRGSPLFGFGRPKSANSTSSRSPSLTTPASARHNPIRLEDDDDTPVLTIRREFEPLNQRVSGLGVDLFPTGRESNDGDILELGESDEDSVIAVEDDSDYELDPRPKYSPRQGKAYALLGLPSPPTLTPTPMTLPAIRRPPMNPSPAAPTTPLPPPSPSTHSDRSIPAFPCTQTDLSSFVHAAAEIRVYAHLTTAFRRKKWRPRWIILTLSPNSSTATLRSFKHRLGTSAKDSKDEPETGRLELVGTTEIYVPVEQMGEKYVLNVTGTTSIMEGTKRLDVMSNILLSFSDIESFKYWMTLLKTTVVELNDEKHSTLSIHRKMSDALSPTTNRNSLSSFESPSLSFDSRTDSSTIGFDGNLDKSWEDNQQPPLPATTRESFSTIPRRTAPIPPHSRNRSTELANPIIPIAATNHAPPPLDPPTTALPLTPPHSGSLYGSFPSPPARQNRPSSAFAHPPTSTSNQYPMDDFEPSVMSGAASTYSRASIRSLPVPLSARSSVSSRSRSKGPPSLPPPSTDLPFLPPIPPSSGRPASADAMMMSRNRSRIASPSQTLPSPPPTGALPLPPPPMSGLPPLPIGAPGLPIPISLSSRRLIKKPSRIVVAGQ